tara:strand:- start:15859 stop:16275 length:417 start_codon:yes stop_codon:yes gene_type:complete
MIALGEKMHAESNFRDLDFDKEKLKNLGWHVVNGEDRYFACVAEDENNCILGMFVGLITEYYFGNDLMASDLLVYVDKSKRGAMASVRMFKEFEKWAKRKNAKEVRPATSTGIEIERTKKLYTHLGYEVSGNTFRKVL